MSEHDYAVNVMLDEGVAAMPWAAQVNEARLQQAALAALVQAGAAADAEMTVVVTTNEAVQTLNQQYRGVDAPTDVLSFPTDDVVAMMSDYLGDVLIALPYAAAQAEREGHPLLDSLALLVVHGTLHLLGYDHDTPEARADMWAVQAAALGALGLSEELVPRHDDDMADADHA